MPITHHLFAAVWNPTAASTQGLSLQEKKNQFRSAVETAYANMSSVAPKISLTNVVYVFACPEYYWAGKFATRGSTTKEKDSIYQTLSEISSSSPGMVIFPGTVNWKVPRNQYQGTVNKYGKNNTERPYATHTILPVYLNGLRVLEHYKQFNDKLINNGDWTGDEGQGEAFAADITAGAHTFKAKGLRFGVEICGDHRVGRLSSFVKNAKLDVMVMVASTMAHDFTNEEMRKIPVRDGGAFIHADGIGKDAERGMKNGLWVPQRGSGWHGNTLMENTLAFEDIDKVRRTIAFPMAVKSNATTLRLSALAGFQPLNEITAAVGRLSGTEPKIFTFEIPGKKVQTVRVEVLPGDKCKLKVSRSLSFGVTREVPFRRADAAGLLATGTGNVNKIGKIGGGTKLKDLSCYYTPI